MMKIRYCHRSFIPLLSAYLFEEAFQVGFVHLHTAEAALGSLCLALRCDLPRKVPGGKPSTGLHHISLTLQLLSTETRIPSSQQHLGEYGRRKMVCKCMHVRVRPPGAFRETKKQCVLQRRIPWSQVCPHHLNGLSALRREVQQVL